MLRNVARRSAARAVFALAAVPAFVLAAPEIAVWPDVLRVCTTVSTPPVVVDSVVRAPGTSRSLLDRVYPITIVNKGDRDLLITSLPLVSSSTGVASATRDRVNGGNFVQLAPAQPPADFVIVPNPPPNPLLSEPFFEATTNCVDMLGNAVPIGSGASCQINLRPRCPGCLKPTKLALTIGSNDPAQPLQWVPVYVDLPGCQPGGLIASLQPQPLRPAPYAGRPRAENPILAFKTKECNCTRQSVSCGRIVNGVRYQAEASGPPALVCEESATCGSCCGNFQDHVCERRLDAQIR